MTTYGGACGGVHAPHLIYITTPYSWYPSILNIFYQGHKKNEWGALLHDKMESFFQTVAYIMSTQLREIVMSSMRDFVKLFDGNHYHAMYAKSDARPVAFNVRLVLDGSEIKFDPPLDEVQSTAKALFDQLLVAADKIPKVECQLFMSTNTMTKAKQSHADLTYVNVSFEQTFKAEVEDARKQVYDSIERMLSAPTAHLKEFSRFDHLIKYTADAEVTQFIEETHTLQQQTDVGGKKRQ